jgi:hypothetical protein
MPKKWQDRFLSDTAPQSLSKARANTMIEQQSTYSTKSTLGKRGPTLEIDNDQNEQSDKEPFDAHDYRRHKRPKLERAVYRPVRRRLRYGHLAPCRRETLLVRSSTSSHSPTVVKHVPENESATRPESFVGMNPDTTNPYDYYFHPPKQASFNSTHSADDRESPVSEKGATTILSTEPPVSLSL